MTLTSDFQFSQNNLQDYVDCPRRFELRYILRRRWPAVQSEPVLEQERQMELGRQFHLVVQQDVLGLDRQLLSEYAESQGLESWWRAYLDHDPLANLPARRIAEHQLVTHIAGYRLLAQFDLLAFEPGRRLVILDWKTSRRRTPRNFLQNRLQTRVYPLVLVEAGQSLFGGQPIPPDAVTMLYWFTEYPADPEKFTYSVSQYAADQAYLTDLVGEIAAKREGQFPLTPDERKCLYCNYRSLCERGQKAGDWQEEEEGPSQDPAAPLDLNFEQIGEVGF
jgi:hypothetical protein